MDRQRRSEHTKFIRIVGDDRSATGLRFVGLRVEARLVWNGFSLRRGDLCGAVVGGIVLLMSPHRHGGGVDIPSGSVTSVGPRWALD